MDDASTSALALSDNDRLRLLVAGVSDYAVFMLSPEGKVRSWNTGAERIKGYLPEEIIGEHFSRFYSAEDRATGKPERALQIARDHGRFEEEGWRVRKDGSRFWASVVMDAIHDENGRFVGFAKITRDITLRKQAQEALRASEERFRLLVQSVTDYAIYMLSPEGLISNWNSGAERFKGHTFEEVEGSHFSRFYTEEDRAQGLPEKALRTAAEEGRFEGEGWRVRKDGSRFWAHVIIDPVRNDLGELIGYAKITRDITEKRETAEALEKAREALFHSQKLEALGKLTGGVAHDFNNLLSVIMNGLEIFGARLQDPVDLRLLDGMKRAAERGATLNQQLLTFARRQPLRQEKHDLNQVIGGFEAVLRRVFDGSVQFRLDSSPLRKVLIDASQFEAALLNLSSNARDAMPEGGTFTITTENVTLAEGQIAKLKEGNYVKVTVSDTGMGMPPEIIPLVIDPFFTTKPIGKGTGMGLSQVYGMVQQSGGDLHIDSTPGAGSSIQLFLPAIDDEGAASHVYASPRPDRALVVDDQPDVLMMAVELFQILGYEVKSASNGKDALDILRQDSRIDVLFTDVVMPGMNGVQLAEQALALNPDIRVVLASGYPGTTLQECKVDPKRFQLLRKPYRTAELLRVLRQS